MKITKERICVLFISAGLLADWALPTQAAIKGPLPGFKSPAADSFMTVTAHSQRFVF